MWWWWSSGPTRNYTKLLSTAISDGRLANEMPRGILYTLRELRMTAFMNAVMDKPNWVSKVFDTTIIQKYKAEVVIAPYKQFSEKMFQYCIDELQHKARLCEKSGAVTVFDGDVVKSDTAVSEQLRQSLIEAVKPLEDVPENLKDWHPGSNGTVLNLVHPSLFPLYYEHTRVLPEGQTVGLEDCISRCGEGEAPHHPGYENSKYSEDFQWLPCEVDISQEQPKITSYINNLHPEKHQNLYHVIEDFIRCSIPLWNQTLTPLVANCSDFQRISYKTVEFENHPDGIPYHDMPEEYDDDPERQELWFKDFHQDIKQPEPELFSEQLKNHVESWKDYYTDAGELKQEWRMDLKSENAHRGLQVIVKLANIELTPEKPEYKGGSWHVEGALNERIVATSLYYYSNENITNSTLSFRQASRWDLDVKYDQDRHEWLEYIYGFENDDAPIQELGSVSTSQGRLLTFPNTLQHRVDPFRLSDSMKPGHRKILALFLIDPNHRPISTARVPCQRADWWGESLMKNEGRLGKLPSELQDMIVDRIDGFPISMVEAEKVREELMAERSDFGKNVIEAFHNVTFGLCEH